MAVVADKVVYKANKNYSQFTVVADKVVHGEQKLQSKERLSCYHKGKSYMKLVVTSGKAYYQEVKKG
jgi:hypothetical protein